jgi:hypothetical protein
MVVKQRPSHRTGAVYPAPESSFGGKIAKFYIRSIEVNDNTMTTFWISFSDPEAGADKRFLGVAIFDLDETDGERSMGEIIQEAWRLGINPGGAAAISACPQAIPSEYKNKLITDDATLLELGSTGRARPN